MLKTANIDLSAGSTAASAIGSGGGGRKPN
jgi:hypothetical protein